MKYLHILVLTFILHCDNAKQDDKEFKDELIRCSLIIQIFAKEDILKNVLGITSCAFYANDKADEKQ
jgi:hypothetical protein